MKKYKLPLFLFIHGAALFVLSMISMSSLDGLFTKILDLFSVPPRAHLAWMMLGANLGVFSMHLSFCVALGMSMQKIFKGPTRFDRWVFGVSLFLVASVLLLWVVDWSYPVPYDTWALLTH